MTKIATFFEDISFKLNVKDQDGQAYREDVLKLIKLHDSSFGACGWEVVMVGMEHARRHRLYARFCELNDLYAASRNNFDYTRICYMRWLAYAESGLPFADLDVINFGFCPEMAEPFVKGTLPVLNSGSNSMGLLSHEHYGQILDSFLSAMERVEEHRRNLDDLNDMSLLKAARPDIYRTIPYEDERFVKNYGDPGWDNALLVHFPHRVPRPRHSTVEKVLNDRDTPWFREP